MGQVTIYIDAETEKKMIASAKAANVSKSRWISAVIREKVDTEWPESARELAGAWVDFPSLDEIRSDIGDDVEREDF